MVTRRTHDHYDDTISPKKCAQDKRGQRYMHPRFKRKADPNGQSKRRYAWQEKEPKANLVKRVRTKSVSTQTNTTHGRTKLERDLGIHLETGRKYSLNKKKRWLFLDLCEEAKVIDGKVKTRKGHESSVRAGTSGRDRHIGDQTVVACFDVEGMQDDYAWMVRQTQRYDRMAGMNAQNDEVTGEQVRYIRDEHYKRMQLKREAWKRKHWQFLQTNAVPVGIGKEENALYRIPIASLMSNSIAQECRIQSAKVEAFSPKACWMPKEGVVHPTKTTHRERPSSSKRLHNHCREKRQKKCKTKGEAMPKGQSSLACLIIDLSQDYVVAGVSTKGRCLVRDKDWNIDTDKCSPEYVRKYKVFCKLDTKEPVCRSYEEFGSKRDIGWLFLGVFSGNSDAETEVFNYLRSDVLGVKCRYLKIVPCAKEQGGYHRRIAMRVGVYAWRKEDESEMETQSVSKMHGKCESKAEMVRDESVDCAMFCVTQQKNKWGAEDPASLCYQDADCHQFGFSNVGFPGICSCNCCMCSDRASIRRHRKKQKRLDSKLFGKFKFVNSKRGEQLWLDSVREIPGCSY